MSSEKIYLTKEEQIFLIEMLEIKDPGKAAERFAQLMILEKADPADLNEYIRKVMKRVNEKVKK